jgi:small subunit ribosomal protein S17e
MKRIERGPVRGISIKLQEEERERRDNFVPDQSQLTPGDEGIQIDAETKKMLAEMDFAGLPGLNIPSARQASYGRR